MLQLASLILTLTCILVIVVILTRNFLTLSKSKHSGKISVDFEFMKVFKFHMEREPKL